MLNELKIKRFWSIFSIEFYCGVNKGVQFLFGGKQMGPVLIWGYAKGFSFDLGVRGYQKVENRWSKVDFKEVFR